MIPLRDNLPTRHAPVVTLLFIGINAYAFLKLFWLGSYAGQRYLLYYGLIPCSLTGSCQVTGRAFTPEVTLLTSMFVHAGFFHFAGNMLYLWIFGNNVEDAMGKVRFVGFYLLCGLAAAYAQILTGPAARIPMVGASGAVSGVLGAYLLLFPHARVLTLVPLGFFIHMAEIRAVFVLGFWTASRGSPTSAVLRQGASSSGSSRSAPCRGGGSGIARSERRLLDPRR
ncbi:MAG: putative peptidase, (Rhomboid) family [candidate division NC10 bacterium]|nr:putative peptidase, (Rhomboid) family [candidate division NC10 bacterium]